MTQLSENKKNDSKLDDHLTNKDTAKIAANTSIWKFLIPSILGTILFMVPIKYENNWTLIIKIISDYIGSYIGSWLPTLCLIIISISGIFSVLAIIKTRFNRKYPIIYKLFKTTPAWLTVRLLGMIFVWIVYFCPENKNNTESLVNMIVSADLGGGFILNDLLSLLVVTFFIAAFLLPLLIDFGLPEFIGALFTKIMRPVFTIPGRAAIDSLTSWIGDGTLGVMLTVNQYEEGYYTKREAAVIASTFSAVSITFCIVVLSQVEMIEYFGVFYLLICTIGFVCALIIPRIPPLSMKKDEFIKPGNAVGETLPNGYTSSFKYGIDLAKCKAGAYKGISQFLKNGFLNMTGMWFGVMPVIMFIGTISLLLANNTPVFEYLGKPFLPLLEFLDIPQAAEASKTMIVGFTDMFTPSIIAANCIESPITKFIVAVISVTQLIYLSEIGGIILGSKIPLNILELFIIFLERTIISLLIAAPLAHLIF